MDQPECRLYSYDMVITNSCMIVVRRGARRKNNFSVNMQENLVTSYKGFDFRNSFQGCLRCTHFSYFNIKDTSESRS
jgi:hypothetical protein